MVEPQSTWWKKAIVWPWGTWVVFVLVMVPHAILAVSEFAQDRPDPLLVWAIAVVDKHPIVIYAGACGVPVYAAFCAFRKKLAEPKGELSQEGLVQLLDSIDTVVGKKSNRFRAKALQVSESKEGVSAQEIFESITRPDVQYESLIRAFYIFLELLYNDNEGPITRFRVVLARMSGDRVREFVRFEPEDYPPRASAEELRQGNSTFNEAAKKRELIIISDIAKEIRKRSPRFHAAEDGTRTGSIMCYPLRYERDVPFVISVYADRPRAFPEKEWEFKKWQRVFERFEKRLILEYSLDILRHGAVRLEGETHDANR